MSDFGRRAFPNERPIGVDPTTFVVVVTLLQHEHVAVSAPTLPLEHREDRLGHLGLDEQAATRPQRAGRGIDEGPVLVVTEVAEAAGPAQYGVELGRPGKVPHVPRLERRPNPTLSSPRTGERHQLLVQIDSCELVAARCERDRHPALAARHVQHPAPGLERQHAFGERGLLFGSLEVGLAGLEVEPGADEERPPPLLVPL
jgi:hypothetical protein